MQPLFTVDDIKREKMKKIIVPPKPDYSSYNRKYLDTESITEAEQMIDDDRQRYKEAVQEWWKKLTPEQQRKAWRDDKQLIFYVQKPKKK